MIERSIPCRLATFLAGLAVCLSFIAPIALEAEEASAKPADARTVTLTGDPWPPYFLGELGYEATGGRGVELIHEIFARIEGAEAKIPLVPWNRALKEVEEGTKDGIGILMKTAERERYMVYTDPIFGSTNTIWYSTERFPDGFEWESYEDLEPYTIGVVRGHTYGEELDALISAGDLPTIEVSSAGQVFAMLARGRIDLAIADRRVGEALATQESPAIRVSARDAAGEVYYIAFSRRSEARHLIPEVNRAIGELREEGVIDALVGGSIPPAGPD